MVASASWAVLASCPSLLRVRRDAVVIRAFAESWLPDHDHRVLEEASGVLLDLAQSGHMRASEDAANHVLGGLKRVGNNHKPNIERANFAVLRTSDMPAMLVETAFISNPDEEKRLRAALATFAEDLRDAAMAKGEALRSQL